jgi:hypothetical protein
MICQEEGLTKYIDSLCRGKISKKEYDGKDRNQAGNPKEKPGFQDTNGKQ